MNLGRRLTSEEIPTSSMADIAFLLIIYFMVCSTLAASRGLDYNQPPADDKAVEVDPVESVLVEVLAGGKLRVDSQPMELGAILSYLEPKLKQNPKKPVILRSMPDAPYGSMVEVFDLLRQGKERLQLSEDIQIAIPTEREIESFWLSGAGIG